MKTIFTRQEQMAALAESISDRVSIALANGEMQQREADILNNVVNYAQSVVLYYKTTSADTIMQVFNLLIQTHNYLKIPNNSGKIVILNIINAKLNKLNVIHSSNNIEHNITM